MDFGRSNGLELASTHVFLFGGMDIQCHDSEHNETINKNHIFTVPIAFAIVIVISVLWYISWISQKPV